MSKSNWILGPSCIQGCKEVWKSFQRKRLEEVQKQIPEATRYNPWLWIVRERPELIDLLEVEKLSHDRLVLADSTNLHLVDRAMADVDGFPMGRASRNIQTSILSNPTEKFPQLQSLVASSVSLQAKVNPWIHEIFSDFIWGIVPIYHEKDGKPWRRGFSSIDCPGIIFTSFLERTNTLESTARAQMTIDLGHELAHQILMVFQCADTIIDGDLSLPVYSSVRRTYRPAIMSFHAAFAMAYMIESCVGMMSSTHATSVEQEYARLSLIDFQSHQQACLQELKSKCIFTDLGKKMMGEMQFQLESLDKFLSSQDLAV